MIWSNICIEHEAWNTFDVEKFTEDCVKAVFSALGMDEVIFESAEKMEICFLFTGDEEVRVLNKAFRNVDRPTNVLSFPMDSFCEEEESEFSEDDEEYISEDTEDDAGSFCYCDDQQASRILGSIAFAYETIDQESKESRMSFEDHLKHLIIHGILHILGYDHVDDNDAEKMEALEVEVLKILKIANPYEFEGSC